MRVAVGERPVEPHFVEEGGDAGVGVRAAGEAVDRERLAQGLPHRHPRVEGAVRILEHDLHAAAQGAQLPGRQREHVAAFEQRGAARRLRQPQQGPRDGGFSAPRLAHEPQRLPRRDRERHAVDGPHHALRLAQAEPCALAGIVLDEIADVDERGGRVHGAGRRRCGSTTSQQRAVWPGVPASSSGGSSRRHLSHAWGQRGWKRHPAGQCVAAGTFPGML